MVILKSWNHGWHRCYGNISHHLTTNPVNANFLKGQDRILCLLELPVFSRMWPAVLFPELISLSCSNMLHTYTWCFYLHIAKDGWHPRNGKQVRVPDESGSFPHPGTSSLRMANWIYFSEAAMPPVPRHVEGTRNPIYWCYVPFEFLKLSQPGFLLYVCCIFVLRFVSQGKVCVCVLLIFCILYLS